MTSVVARSGGSLRNEDQSKIDWLFQRADTEWQAGNLRSAFRLFLRCAKAGDLGCQGQPRDADGVGVKRNRARALYWYRRAYRRGASSAAANIGIIFRDENKLRPALVWFERAAKRKDADANLEIAKIHIQQGDRAKAIKHLNRTCKAKAGDVTEASREEAEKILKRMLKHRA